MNKSLWLIAAMALGLTAQAQTPPKPLQEAQEVLGDVVRINQLPTNFNYQALITEKGRVVADKELKLKITLLKDAEHHYFVEEHEVKTSSTGLVNLLVGTGTPVQGTLADVKWDEGIFIAIDANFGSGYQSLGAPVKMMAAPYAQCALTAPVVRGTGLDKDQPIFQVQNADGFPIFSVYEDAISMNVAEDAEGTRRPRGGFAVRSFKAASMRDDKPRFEAIDRLKLVDGSFHAYIDSDPDTRRPRGGFAVMTPNNALRGENTPETDAPVMLMNLAQRESYFTLDKNLAGSALQLRNRCDNKEVILAFASDGKIETQQKKESAIIKVDDTPGKQLSVSWPMEDNPTAASSVLYFNNFVRWRAPKVELDGEDKLSYKIELIDLEEGRKISDYLEVGYHKSNDGKSLYGLSVKPTVDIHGIAIPDGKIKISSVANPRLARVLDFRHQTMADTIDLTTERANINLSKNKIESTVDVDCKRAGAPETYDAFLNNLSITVVPRKASELSSDESTSVYKVMEGALAFTLNGTKLTLKIVDKAKFLEALGTFTGEVEVKVPIWYQFPEAVVAKEGKGQNMKKIYARSFVNLLVEE